MADVIIVIAIVLFGLFASMLNLSTDKKDKKWKSHNLPQFHIISHNYHIIIT